MRARAPTPAKVPKIDPAKLEPDVIVESGPVVESGPIDYDGAELEEEMFSDEDLQHVSAAQLMGRTVTVDELYDDDY